MAHPFRPFDFSWGSMKFKLKRSFVDRLHCGTVLFAELIGGEDSDLHQVKTKLNRRMTRNTNLFGGLMLSLPSYDSVPFLLLDVRRRRLLWFCFRERSANGYVYHFRNIFRASCGSDGLRPNKFYKINKLVSLIFSFS